MTEQEQKEQAEEVRYAADTLQKNLAADDSPIWRDGGDDEQ